MLVLGGKFWGKFEVKFTTVKFKKGEPNLTRRSKFNAEFKCVKFTVFIIAFCPFFLDCRMQTCRR